MKVIDLTHTISPHMPVYPGTEPPVITAACSLEKDGFVERRITLYSHTGTHMDAPAHILQGAKTLDALPVSHFTGRACALALTGLESPAIGVGELEPYAELMDRVDFVLLHTGWGRFWGSGRYFEGYPVLTEEAARYLCGRSLKGVGVDAISVDPTPSEKLPVHRILLERDIVVVENLANLEALPEGVFRFACFPLKLQDADGSPVRAVAFVE